MMLRQLADAGRVVIVVTHMLSYLETCDQLLLVAPGGKTAYCGPPDQIGEAMGTTNWAKIFTKVGADPEEANRRFWPSVRPQQRPQKLLPDKADEPGDLGEPVHTSVRRQISTVARRQIRLVVADRAYFIFLALLPFILGSLSLTVPGSNGFHLPGPNAGHARRIRADTGPADARRGVHGHRADDPRPGRRTRHLPARASGRAVDNGLPAREDRGVLRVRDPAVGDHHRDRGDRQERADTWRRAARPFDTSRRPSSCSRPSRRPVWPRPFSAWPFRRWSAPASRSCRCSW